MPGSGPMPCSTRGPRCRQAPPWAGPPPPPMAASPGWATRAPGSSSVMAMEFTPRRRLELVSGRSHPELAQDVARQLGVELGEANLREFANGEIHCRYG